MRNLFTSCLVVGCMLLSSFIARGQDIAVSGKVTDTAGAPLPGVSVVLKGTTRGTQTNENGNYTIQAPGNGTLSFSYVTFTAQEIPVDNKAIINISLKPEANALEEVVVVGYGTQRKLDVTGSVSSLKGEEISKQSSSDAASSLQGKVAGVQITNAGTPGASPKVVIRGQGTIYGNTNLLYVVDGVWYDNINFLNPGDISNMSVLKDASAQSIYGIRAANGVVLITTKKGSAGHATLDYNGYAGFQKITNQVEMASASEYATMINELAGYNNASPLFDNTETFSASTNWYDEALRTAFVTSHQLSLNGASEKSSYNVSLGYLDQDGLVIGNNYKRYTARFNNEIKFSKILEAGFNVTGMYNPTKDVPTGIWHELYAGAPVVPAYNADGSYGDPFSYDLGSAVQANPLATLAAYNQLSKNYKVTGNVYAAVHITPDLTFKTSFGGDFGQEEYRNYVGVYDYTTAQQNNTSKLTLGRTEIRNWILENTLTYNKEIDQHKFTVLLGQSAQRYKTYISTAYGEGVPYSSEGDLYLDLADAGTLDYNDEGSLTTAASYFGRINYSFSDKYLVNASIRADGASQFYGGGELWGYFPSVGLGWVISNENFMKDQTIFDNLKLRGSWGKIGNAGVPINPTRITVDNGANLVAIWGSQQAASTGASITTIAAPVLNWERIAGTDIGLEAAFLGNRLSVEADWYNKITEQAIFGIPVFADLGLSNDQIISNQASFRNRGAELSVNWSEKKESGFAYSVGANISMNNNLVTKVNSGANPILTGGTGITNGAVVTRTVQGQPIGEFYGYQVTGVFQTAEEIASSMQTTAIPGDFKFADINNDGKIDGRDRTAIGNPNPKYSYGLNSNFSYKNFDLSLDFQGVADADIYNGNIAYRYGNENFTKDFYENRWHGENTSNTYPSTNVGSTANSAPSTFYVESGAYFRIRNIQLGYTLPKSLTDRWRFNRIRIYANAQNALNVFGYRGFSPEVVSDNLLTSGVDANVYPLYATYNFGINLTF